MVSFLKNNFISISLGTALSKLAGFARQIFIAAVFGIGITYDAYNYAYIIPGFLIIIIGGINGPLHNAIVSILTPLEPKRAGLVFKNISVKISILFFLIGLIIFFNSELIISIVGPNLDFETQSIAIQQLKILAPCIPLSGFIGLSYGALNSKNKFFISSISPAIISLVTIILLACRWLSPTKDLFQNNLLDKELLAVATLTGTFIQFLLQFFEMFKIGFIDFRGRIISFLDEEKRILKLIIPATFSSGLGQINVLVDMFFASSFKGAASGLAYGNFIIQAPLGILSNSLILPLLPKLSNLLNQNDRKLFRIKLLSTIEYSLLTTFFLTGFFISFNDQIVNILFERGAFKSEAAITVRKILIAYSLGLPAYLYRELIVRVYYILEETKLPFKVSLIGIVLNITFDWILIGAPISSLDNLLPYNFGVIGIVLSSGLVNCIICVILSFKLGNFTDEIPLNYLFRKIALIMISCTVSSYISFNAFYYHQGNNIILQILSLSFGFLIYFLLYIFTTKIFKVNNFKLKLFK